MLILSINGVLFWVVLFWNKRLRMLSKSGMRMVSHRLCKGHDRRLTICALPDLEAAAALAGMPVAIVKSEEEWQATPHGSIMSSLPIVNTRYVPTSAPPKPFPPNPKRPLEGLKVLCATHAIAGPTVGRTLAEHGASVLQVMFTHGFEHNFVYTYANLGTASTRLNFHKESDKARMWELIQDADVWVDSYREGGLSKFGFTDAEMHKCNPGLIITHVRCYGIEGPWRNKPGFDMQGSASSGLMVHCGGGLETPSWPPGMVINDYTTGYFGALAVQACILRRMKEGGGFIVGPSLTGTAMSILKYFKALPEKNFVGEALGPEQLEGETGMGYLKTLAPLPKLSLTPIEYKFLLVPIGSSVPAYPGEENGYDVLKQVPREKHQAVSDFAIPLMRRLVKLREIGVAGLEGMENLTT
jgi:CoA-transferase family III